MSNYLSDSTNCTMSEAQLSSLLSHFSTDFIFQVIMDNITNKFSNYYSTIPNIVQSYEQNFKQLLNDYPFGKDEIIEVRDQTYAEIISTLCNHYGLQFHVDSSSTYYTSALLLYDLLVSNFRLYIINFLTNYIMRESKGLYNNLQLGRFKKDKNADILYNKKVFTDPIISIIVTNIDFVISNILTFDIDFNDFLSLGVLDTNRTNFLKTIISCDCDFFKQVIVPVLTNDANTRSIIDMDVKINIQRLSSTNNLNIMNGEGNK